MPPAAPQRAQKYSPWRRAWWRRKRRKTLSPPEFADQPLAATDLPEGEIMNDLSLAPPAHAARAAADLAGCDARREQPLVLVVDDEPLMLEMLEITLEDEGFAVECAADGVQGLAAFERLRPDLVLTDANMPLMNGFELCAALRAHPHGRHIPILMLTAAGDAQSIRRAFTSGATDFATKPLQEDLIGYRLRYLLEASRNMRELARSEGRLANAQRIGRIGHWDLELGSDLMTVSDEVCSIIGTTRSKSPRTGKTFMRFVHPEDRAAALQWLLGVVTGAAPARFECRIMRPDGDVRHAVIQTEVASAENGRAVRLEGILQDISDRRQAEERIRYLAMYDGLTGLPNRRLCAEKLDGALARAARHSTPLAVMIVGLDGFKQINEARGHAAGDKLLMKVGGRLLRCMRDSDQVARVAGPQSQEEVARLAGDTFALAMSELARAADATAVAVRVQEYLAQPYFIDDQTLYITACVGIAIHGIDGDSAEDLLKNAESAMHVAKQGGHNALRFFTATMNADAARKLALANDLRRAVGKQQFNLHFQPQVDLASGRIIGAEALIRWDHPQLGRIAPFDFIPLAEELGLIVEIGEWVTKTACIAAQAWQRPGMPAVSVAVNVSPKQFRDPDLLRMVERVLKESGLPAGCLELEVTEGVMISDPEATIANMRALRDLGVQLAIDDFGTGYSSLSYLKELPIQRLKIDQSFVRGLDVDLQSASIAHAVIVLGHALNLKVVAEGVETAFHVARLAELGCDEIQGYLVAKPMPEAQFVQMLHSDWCLSA